LTTEDSPIVVNSGSLVFRDTSLLNFTTPVSTLTVNNGNFELYDTGFLAAPEEFWMFSSNKEYS